MGQRVRQENTTIYLVRHAESQPNHDLLEEDWPLSPRGREQALILASRLGEFDVNVIYSSPYRRAIDTVRPFAMQAGLEISIHQDLRERKLIEGSTPDFRALVKRTWEDFTFAALGGESNATCQARMVRTMRELVKRHPNTTILIASHGNAIGLFLNSIELMFGFEHWAAMRNPDLFKIEAKGHTFAWDRSIRLY